MSQTSFDREVYLQDLLALFDATKINVNNKWNDFISELTANKINWSDTQFYYFEKRVEEIQQGLDYMNRQIEGPITSYIEDNIKHYRTIQNK